MAATAEQHESIAITKENFEAEVTNFPGVVLIDFWAAWCGPCRAMAPRLAEIAKKYADNENVKVVELDVDAEQELAQEHQVLSIPTFKAFVGGKFVDQRIGLIPASELDNLITKGLSQLKPQTAK